MINFDEEIKRFKPATEVENLEDAIFRNDYNDVTDVLLEVMRQTQTNSNSADTEY